MGHCCFVGQKTIVTKCSQPKCDSRNMREPTVKSSFHEINHKECKKTTHNSVLHIKKYKKTEKIEILDFFFYDKKRLVFYTLTTLGTIEAQIGSNAISAL